MMALSDITEYSVSAGATNVDSLAFRKCRRLSKVMLPEGLLTIGDAAFSLCDSLRHIEIPASVERIGVAVFCKSGIESILFRGVPKVIEADTFEGCWQLKEIVVPTGSRDIFVRKFGLPADKTVEGSGHVQITRQTAEQTPVNPKVNLFEQRPIGLSRFSYNARYFYWTIGDEVNLRDVFSGPIIIFVSDDGKTARVFDEVKLVRINTNAITVRSLLKVR